MLFSAVLNSTYGCIQHNYRLQLTERGNPFLWFYISQEFTYAVFRQVENCFLHDANRWTHQRVNIIMAIIPLRN